jgi:hypothetical protein
LTLDTNQNSDNITTMNITFIPHRSITLVTSDNRVLTATKDNPNWAKIEAAIKAKDEKALINAISMKASVENFGNTGKIQVRNGAVYYHKEKLFGEDVNRILSYLHGGFPTDSMVKFLEAKVRNVSPASVASLYSFLENKGMPITDNGTILGYKGVREDYYSVNTGQEPLIAGTRREDGAILNSIGETVWMDRRYVCDDNNQGCAGGLHIGSKDYATGWARGHVMVVEFSPEFVVSVPTYEHAKLRVSKYRVVGELNIGDVLGEVYNGDYARPDETPEPPAKIEIVTPTEAKNRFNISVWTKGMAAGYKDGKAHAKRKFYEVDKGRSFKKYPKEFVNGYLAGYRDGRNN